MLRHLHSNAVWPRRHVLVFLAMIYAVMTGSIRLIVHAFPAAMTNSEAEFLTIRRGMLAGLAGLYAFYRLFRFHPACNQAYGMWLKLTPWTPNKPLPLGPVHLVWQDGALLGVLLAVGWFDAQVPPIWAAATFGIIYLLGMTILLAFTRAWGFCLLMCFLWPALMLPSVRGVGMFVIVAIMFNVVWLGHQQSLRLFPWRFLTLANRPTVTSGLGTVQFNLRIPGLTDMPGTTTRPNVGWPLIRLTPKLDQRSVPGAAAVLWSVLMGWWTYCVNAGLQTPSLPELIVVFAILGSILRFVIYCSAVDTPFSLAARITTGRLILPGFDRVFVTPLAAVIASLIGAVLIRHSGSHYLAVESALVGLIWLVLLSGKPTLSNWLLTGYHRYRPPSRILGNRPLFKPI
jgi:hypothetical protein